MLKKLGLILVVLLVGVLGYAATRPDTIHVERSLTMQAPPAAIVPHIDDLRAWVEWSPWEKIDPSMKRTYSGAARGTGAIYAWEGNANVGSGQMEIIESSPSAVVLDLHFTAPFEARNTGKLALAPTGDATTVTWSMTGPNTFMGKLIGLFLDMDTMVGDQFAAGLANLKAIVEK